jgi:hypothetical protein
VWGKIISGMAGLSIDWLLIAGRTPDLQLLVSRFQEANSLETLLLIVEPFADTSSVVLYNLLQVIGWTAAGALVGSLAWRKWVKYHTPWSIMVVTAAGGVVMLLTHVGLPYWLPEALAKTPGLTAQDPVAPLFSLIVVIIVGTLIYSFRESLDLPVAPPRLATRSIHPPEKVKKIAKRQPFRLFGRSQKSVNEETRETQETSLSDHQPVRVPHQSELPEWEPPKNDSGLIMLEID